MYCLHILLCDISSYCFSLDLIGDIYLLLGILYE